VQFLVDFACRAGASARRRALPPGGVPEIPLPYNHLNITPPITSPAPRSNVLTFPVTFHAIVTPKLHHSCTIPAPIFENAFHYPPAPQPLTKSHPKNGAISD
jgi:hypothetical protein